MDKIIVTHLEAIYAPQGCLFVSIMRLAVPVPFSLWLHRALVSCPARQNTPATSGGRRCSSHRPCAARCARQHNRGNGDSSREWLENARAADVARHAADR